MARIAVIDDYEGHAHVFSAPLVVAGHTVLTEVMVIDWERVLRFQPEVLCVVLYRQTRAFNRPIQDPAKDILGIDALLAMEKYPTIQLVPIMLVGNAIEEADVPTTVNYDVFLTFPDNIDLYLPKLNELATLVKTRRKISRFACPHCRSRMVYLKEPVTDLFCPRCHTAVSLIDDTHCIMLVEGKGESQPCTTAQLTPPRVSGP